MIAHFPKVGMGKNCQDAYLSTYLQGVVVGGFELKGDSLWELEIKDI